jgi:hypothetical protein
MNVQVNGRPYKMAQWLPTTVAAVLLVWLCRGGGSTMNAPAMAIEGERFVAQAPARALTSTIPMVGRQ